MTSAITLHRDFGVFGVELHMYSELPILRSPILRWVPVVDLSMVLSPVSEICHLFSSFAVMTAGSHAPRPYREIAYRDFPMHKTLVNGIPDIPIPD
jgi:hypothetical protein